jgi:hypothetical protein
MRGLVGDVRAVEVYLTPLAFAPTLQRAREVSDPQQLQHFDINSIRLMFGR